ncbi:MAG TPA: hypothetical protein VGP37_07235 [Candidatus Nanopelagicales bacterium]|nr:hypothetical protein [Candidatus Nanopelagicales bacterium]
MSEQQTGESIAGTVVCVTIVAESILEARLVEDLRVAGALGWTITPARGQGPRDRRVSEIEGGNVRVETLVSAEVAERIWAVLTSDYFANYAIAAWTNDVCVARPERYVGSSAPHDTAR